jgi:hypothetical protein
MLGFQFYKMNKQEKIELYFAFFSLIVAITNVFIILLNAPLIFLEPFSIGLSLIIFYYGYFKIVESEIFNKIKTLFLIHHLESEAKKEAKNIIENAKQTS